VQGRLRLAFPLAAAAQVGVSLGEAEVKLDGAAQRGVRIGQLAGLHLGQAELVVEAGVLRLQQHQPPVERDRVFAGGEEVDISARAVGHGSGRRQVDRAAAKDAGVKRHKDYAPSDLR